MKPFIKFVVLALSVVLVACDSHSSFIPTAPTGVSEQITSPIPPTNAGEQTTLPTPPANAGGQQPVFQPPVTLYATGDISNCDAGHLNVLNGKFGHQYVAQLLQTFHLDGIYRIFLALGDIAYFQGSSGQFSNCYDPWFSVFKPNTRPTPGNHEYETPNAAGYFSYFGSAAGPGYYSWDPPGDSWHIVSGNSNLSGGAKIAYLAWLENDLTINRRPCTVVYWHYPRFSSGIAGNMVSDVGDDFKVLYNHRVTLLLVGHDHDYEEFEPQDPDERFDLHGVKEFVIGTGGAELRPLVGRKPNSIVWNNSSWGVLVLTLGPRNYQWQFLSATGSFGSSGAGQCSE